MSVYITGHSLGAARAALYAWHRSEAGLQTQGLYLFGCPNPGDRVLASLVRTHVPVLRSIKNRRDLVTDVPVDIRFIGEDYAAVTTFEETDEQSVDYTGLFRDHHVSLYQVGCAKLPASPPPATVSLVDAVNAVVDQYDDVGSWAFQNRTDGQYCGVRMMPSGDKLLVMRGTAEPLDWLDDFDARQVNVGGVWVSDGFWQQVMPLIPALDVLL